MGMGAPKQGSTLPPQGGKGGVQQPGQPMFPGMGLPPAQPQVQQRLSDMPQIQAAYGNPPSRPQVQQPYPGTQMPAQVPAQGGKGRDFGPNVFPGPQQPGQVPAQGGKGTSQQDYDRMMAQVSFAPGTTPPTYEEFVQNRLNPKPMPQVMPQKPGVPAQGGKGGVQQPQGPRPFDETGSLRQDPRVAQLINQGNMQGARDLQNQLAREKGLGGTLPQIPAQGGKAPLTPEQIAAIAPNIDPARPIPQVSPPQGGFPQRDLGYGNQLPQGMPRPVPQVQQPAPVMPRPVPQVMPRQPTPKPAPQGLAQMQQFLKQQQMLKGRR